MKKLKLSLKWSMVLLLMTTLSISKITSQNLIRYPYAQLKSDTLEIVFTPKQTKEMRVNSILLKDNIIYSDKLEKVIDTLNNSIILCNSDKELQKVIIDNLKKVNINNEILIEEQSKVLYQNNVNYNAIQSQLHANQILYLKLEKSKNKWKNGLLSILGGASIFAIAKLL